MSAAECMACGAPAAPSDDGAPLCTPCTVHGPARLRADFECPACDTPGGACDCAAMACPACGGLFDCEADCPAAIAREESGMLRSEDPASGFERDTPPDE